MSGVCFWYWVICYFSLLRQRKVTKRKATQLNRYSLLCFNFLYGNFATRGKAAQTEQNCLKIESRKGDLYGEFFLSSVCFGEGDIFIAWGGL